MYAHQSLKLNKCEWMLREREHERKKERKGKIVSLWGKETNARRCCEGFDLGKKRGRENVAGMKAKGESCGKGKRQRVNLRGTRVRVSACACVCVRVWNMCLRNKKETCVRRCSEEKALYVAIIETVSVIIIKNRETIQAISVC